MNIDFELYRIFYVVAKNGNITRASEELMISQPAISKSIKNLEEQLGGQLFVRSKRGVILTEEGKTFYSYIKQAIEYISSAENKFSELINLEIGCIKIGVSATLTKEFLLPYLKEFHSLYPHIDIQIDTNLSPVLMHKLKNGLLDIVILNLNNEDYGEDVEVVRCKEVHDCFVVSDKYKNLLNRQVSLSEINEYPLILQMKGSNTRTFFDEFIKSNGILVNPNIELASYSLVVEFAKIGLGVGYVTKEYISKELEKGELKVVNLEEQIPSRYLGLAISKNHLPNFSTKKLMEMITKKG